ncbi:MltA domain-containing protein [Rhabdaerophilum sp. SD176]|uniref:murein transglycosylase A n=1 Tax=Rhabdaerophilum sp. SD176 TaxID=2983548 RepID=UPI0024DFF283|nr:MltA domain-containing protein [Rhabdaerophilum sp. SD176]
MKPAGKVAQGCLAAMIGALSSMSVSAEPAGSVLSSLLPDGTRTRVLDWAAVPGWSDDNHAEAFSVFLRTCPAGIPALRSGQPRPAALQRACDLAFAGRDVLAADNGQARQFFERHFRPAEIIPLSGAGFLTGYYEPELEASRQKRDGFPEPVLRRPADLVTVPQGEPAPSPLDADLQAWRRGPGGPEPYPDRKAIWAGALAGQGLEIAWLRDKPELFITQVQGSARLRWVDGGVGRLRYAGRNGHPYTSIGRKLVERGIMALETMTLAKLMGWLRENPAEARALMEENRSYVFFQLDESLSPDEGPIGGAGIPLVAGRSLAVDRSIWPYGLPVFIEVSPLVPEGGRKRIARLMIAQDTGSAIVGPARGDFFVGSGSAAGDRAGLFRDPMRFIILVPREMSP